MTRKKKAIERWFARRGVAHLTDPRTGNNLSNATLVRNLQLQLVIRDWAETTLPGA